MSTTARGGDRPTIVLVGHGMVGQQIGRAHV